MKKEQILVLFVFLCLLFVFLYAVAVQPSAEPTFKYCTEKMRVKMRGQLEFSGIIIGKRKYYDSSGIKNKLFIKLDSYNYTGEPITIEQFVVPEGYSLLCDSYILVRDSTLMILQGAEYKSMEKAHVFSQMGDSKIHIEYEPGKYRDYP